jgi:hypothetical protein
MATYYRFQHERPRTGEQVHCFTTIKGLKDFAQMMKFDDPDFGRMKFWEIQGFYIKDDEGDVVVEVTSAKEIKEI